LILSLINYMISIRETIHKIFYILYFICIIKAQTHINSDPFYLLITEKAQFQNPSANQSTLFRPLFYSTDSLAFSFMFRNETYFNDNAPNQENMDVRYFGKGIGNFTSVEVSANSPYFSLLFEPYMRNNHFVEVQDVDNREDLFKVLNDRSLSTNLSEAKHPFNFLAFFHFKGLGFGWHKGNRWWGPGIHSSLQMTNNTQPLMGHIIGTIKEHRIGPFGFYGLYTFARLNQKKGDEAKYFTSLNGRGTWYGPINFTLGFSRNYITGGAKNLSNYEWSEKDARLIVFEGLLTSNIINNEYTVGGHDVWDQTLSMYSIITLPNRNLKIYAEIGMNDNRMYFGDLLSQPDHSMATIFGIRDYGIGIKNFVWGFEWVNLMMTYSSRHRPTGKGIWYDKTIYDYSTYMGRRWGAHSGSDSDDWYFYAGYLSEKFMLIPGLNYERHGIVTHRPAEVKIELRLDTRYKYKDIWFGIYYENQFEAFLGFPDYYYEDKSGNPIDSSDGKLANARKTNTLILSINKIINF
tara:strand:+ start:79283 stop:80842 length:1560 start_codon:yes stop_codon:yes gene_type:complete